MNGHEWQPQVRRAAAELVVAAIGASTMSLRQIAAAADVSVSTVQRAKDPDSLSDIGVGVLWRIAAACGTSLTVVAQPLYDPAAVEAVIAQLAGSSATLSGRQAWWAQRFAALAPHEAIAAAADAAAPHQAPGAVYLAGMRGRPAIGRLASAGDASGSRWALSGAVIPPQRSTALQEPVADTAVLWVEADPKSVVQLLLDTMRVVKPFAAAHCVVAPAPPALLDRIDDSRLPLRWADDLQRSIDAAAMRKDRPRRECR